ncbi:MAG: SGNH/GDSL hydrolase family protein, partial [Ruminococcaceae bacterium]|nr:SGNH/GDSL hydrolase family protein [Oscillospiraceae bacterium]
MQLKGKNIFFLGSSVTYGSASGGISFAEMLAKQYEFNYIKEAVSGTTLVDIGENSYVSRLKKRGTDFKI